MDNKTCPTATPTLIQTEIISDQMPVDQHELGLVAIRGRNYSQMINFFGKNLTKKDDRILKTARKRLLERF